MKRCRSWFLFLALLARPVYSNCCNNCDVSSTNRAAYDAMLQLSDAQKTATEKLHFPWGLPKARTGTPTVTLLCQADYIIGYDEQLRVPVWVGYRLRGADVKLDRPRTECFRRDPLVSEDVSSSCTNFPNPPYDCGQNRIDISIPTPS